MRCNVWRKLIGVLHCLLSLLNGIFGLYSYDVTLSTIGKSGVDTNSQHFLTDHQAFPTRDNFLRFRVMGRQGVRLILESTQKDSPHKIIYYFILIGNDTNKRSAILLVNDTLSGTNFYEIHRNADVSGAVLSEFEWREFWISWCGGTIKVGKGPEYNKDVMMSWTNPCPFKVVDIGITGGYSLSWKFQSTSATEHIVNSCPPKGNCNSYIRRSDCLTFKPMTSFVVSQFDCVWQCSDRDDCWAWDYNAVNGTCNLLSGEPEQITVMGQEVSSVFLKQQDK